MDQTRKIKRTRVEIDSWREEAFIAFWGCQKCAGRGLASEFRFFEEAGIQYGEATCLRCGLTTPYPLSEIP
jgi:hypothetical protein